MTSYTCLGSLDLTLSSRLTTRIIEKLTVEWYLGDGATGASCIASNNASWTFVQMLQHQKIFSIDIILYKKLFKLQIQ